MTHIWYSISARPESKNLRLDHMAEKMSRPDKVHVFIMFIHSHSTTNTEGLCHLAHSVRNVFESWTSMQLHWIILKFNPLLNYFDYEIDSVSENRTKMVTCNVHIFSVLDPTHTERKDKTWWKYFKAGWRANRANWWLRTGVNVFTSCPKILSV